MDCMSWTEETASDPANNNNNNNNNGNGGNGNNGNGNGNINNQNINNVPSNQQQVSQQPPPAAPAAPTIKNHSVTYFNGYLYCFGGYDGRRNHMTLLLYSVQEKRWIRPSQHVQPHVQLQVQQQMQQQMHQQVVHQHMEQQQQIPQIQQQQQQQQLQHPHIQQQQQLAQQQQAINVDGGGGQNVGVVLPAVGVGVGGIIPPLPPLQHPIADHTTTSFTGGDPNIVVLGTPPPGRNGHSATLATDPDDEDNGRIIIIGGWLGTGPLAASDMHILDVSFRSPSSLLIDGDESGSIDTSNGGNAQQAPSASYYEPSSQQQQQQQSQHQQQPEQKQQILRWYQPTVRGTPPGPCNMHSADYVPNQRSVYVFRGGNGREYLNDLHALHVDTLTWKRVETTGEIPQQRANHSSAMLEQTNELFIFGGWNGAERLNDIHILDTETSNWTCPRVGGVLPHPRAGMTLTALRGRLYLFGGSGTSAKCFQDLQILDRQEMAWLDVTPHSDHHNHNHHHHNHHSQRGGHNNNHHQQNPFHPDDNMMFRFGGGDGRFVNDSSSSNNNDGPVQVGYGDHDQGGNSNMINNQQGGAITMRQSFSARSADWRSRDMAVRQAAAAAQQHPLMMNQQGGGGVGDGGGAMNYYPHESPNPNDEDTVPTVLVHGIGPGRRAGHTATAVNRKIYVFGGSCGSDYLNDFFVLDTDPPPTAIVSEPTSLQLVERRLRHFFNDEEFSDVTFVVQGRRVYGHKMVLSIVSDCFRAMFTTGFRESEDKEIEIPDCSHAAFLAVMEYIYTGALPMIGDLSASVNQQQQQQPQDPDSNLGRVVEMLELADRFFLDHLKQICETLLQPCVNSETVEYLLGVAQKTNSTQLQSICEHYRRNRS